MQLWPTGKTCQGNPTLMLSSNSWKALCHHSLIMCQQWKMFYTTPYFIDTSLQNWNVYFQSEILSYILIQSFCFVKIWLLFKLLQKCKLNILRTKLHLPLVHVLDCAVWHWESTCISKKVWSIKGLYYMAATDGSRSTVSTLRIQDVWNSRWTAAFLYSVQFLMTELNLWIQDIYFFLHFF